MLFLVLLFPPLLPSSSFWGNSEIKNFSNIGQRVSIPKNRQFTFIKICLSFILILANSRRHGPAYKQTLANITVVINGEQVSSHEANNALWTIHVHLVASEIDKSLKACALYGPSFWDVDQETHR
ncbi:hypothetical protein ACET6L_10205 [Aeromonas rivipollensis]